MGLHGNLVKGSAEKAWQHVHKQVEQEISVITARQKQNHRYYRPYMSGLVGLFRYCSFTYHLLPRLIVGPSSGRPLGRPPPVSFARTLGSCAAARSMGCRMMAQCSAFSRRAWSATPQRIQRPQKGAEFGHGVGVGPHWYWDSWFDQPRIVCKMLSWMLPLSGKVWTSVPKLFQSKGDWKEAKSSPVWILISFLTQIQGRISLRAQLVRALPCCSSQKIRLSNHHKLYVRNDAKYDGWM